MGNFYTNITMVGAAAGAAASELEALGREAFVADLGQACVVYDRECEKQDTEVLAALAERLATRLDARAFAVLDHDDDLLGFQLYEGATLVAEYANRGGPRTGVRALCRALGRPGAALAVWLLLRRPFLFQVCRDAAGEGLRRRRRRRVGAWAARGPRARYRRAPPRGEPPPRRSRAAGARRSRAGRGRRRCRRA